MRTKIYLSLVALSMLLGALLFTSCKKTNYTQPTITLNGPAVMSIYLQAGVTDPGATAVDNSGNNLTVDIVSSWNGNNPNQNLVGTYTITYFVADATGNTNSVTRTVIVTNSAPNVLGGYLVSDILSGDTSATAHYGVTVSQSVNVNNGVTISNFGDFGTLVNVVATLNASSDSLFIAPQSPTGMSRALISNGLSGSGIFNSSMGILKIKYTAIYSGTKNDTIIGTATYVK